jgi:hypothetical protein
VVVIASGGGLAEPIAMLRLAVADCEEGWLESVTLMVAEAVPPCVGVPVIMPVELLMERPPGRPLAE